MNAAHGHNNPPVAAGDAEWRTRCDLAACYRLVDLYGWSDFFGTHISLRIPGTEHFLLNPLGMMFDEITASSLIKVDVEGRLLSDSRYPINPAGFTIHSAIHMSAPRNNAVIHTHTRAGSAVASLAEGLLPLHQKAAIIRDFVAYHDYEGVALNLGERERIVTDLGDRRVLVLRNHGLLTVGPTIGDAFLWLTRIERACEFQVALLAQGRTIAPLTPEMQDRAARQGREIFVDEGPEGGAAFWPAFLRKLEREAKTDWRV